MFLKRRIKYQFQGYKRMILYKLRFFVLPIWMTGAFARVAYSAVFILIIVGYIGQIVSSSGSGYEMRDLQKNVAILRVEIQKLNVKTTEYKAITNLNERVESFGMVAVNNIIHIKHDITMAKR